MKKETNKDKVEFNLERLKGKEIAVNCVTEEQFQNFITWVNSLRDSIFKNNNWEEYEENSCLWIGSDFIWNYNSIEWFKKEGYKVISYEEALLKESKETTEESKEIIKLQKKITNLQISLSKKDKKIKNQALEISSLLSQKQHLQQQLDSEVSIKEEYSKSLIIIEYLENKLNKK